MQIKKRNFCMCGCGKLVEKKFSRGHGSWGKVVSEETRLKISKSNFGKKRSEATRLKISFATRLRKTESVH